jgi:predicted ATPase/DNA-binding winged helix-turn-helix (wHTH) protein
MAMTAGDHDEGAPCSDQQERQPMAEKRTSPVGDVISFGGYTLYLTQRFIEKDGATLPLGGRALGILIALAERAGEVVGKQDLIARVWPDVTVGESSLRFHVTGLRKALGDGQGGARFVTNIPGRGYCFVALISHPDESPPLLPPPKVTERRPSLPPRLVRMVGRDETVDTVTARLLAQRFVTIVGPGGIGKTTVAIAVADALLASFQNSVYFADFTPLTDASLVPATLASALGLSVRSNNPISAIVGFLHAKRTLIVLDCCEHLIDATALLAERIFAEAPEIHILATSRESMRVEGEQVFRLFPLASPPGDTDISAAEAVKYPAVQLFVERAAARLYPFELLDRDARAVAEICRKLDGIALAIELAAGRVDAYGVEGIVGLLDDRFRLLGQGRRTALPRHQTLAAAFDWSHDLLSRSERVVLRRLSVCMGTFTLQAAQAVAAADDIDAADAIESVTQLVAKSLVSVDTDGLVTRYRLLGTTRAYAFRKLIESGEASSCARRHAEYYAQFLERAEADAAAETTPDEPAAHVQDIDNIRAALEWAFSPDGDVHIGIALAAAACTLLLEWSLLNESRDWAEKALALRDPAAEGTRQEMLLQMCLGITMMHTIGNNDGSLRALTRALALAEQLDDPYYQLHTLEALCGFYQRDADMRGVRAIAARGEAVIKILAGRTGRTYTNWMMASAHQLTGNQAGAREYGEIARRNSVVGRRIRRFSMDRRSNALITLARALWMQGYPDRAMAMAQEVLQEARSLNHAVLSCNPLHWMMSVSLWCGDLHMAQGLAGELLDRAGKYALPSFHARRLGWSGALALRRGDAEDAIPLLRDSLEALDTVRDQQMKTSFLSELAEALAAAGHLDEGLAMIEEVIGRIDRTGEHMYLPEALRKKGDMLAAMPSATIADDLFLRSLTYAHRQGALSWELRTATSFARLRLQQGRPVDARMILAPVYGRFTEGFTTADLRAAESLLNELP